MKKQLKNKKIKLIYFIIIGINIVLFTIPNVYAEENPVVIIDRLSTMIYQMKMDCYMMNNKNILRVPMYLLLDILLQ